MTLALKWQLCADLTFFGLSWWDTCFSWAGDVDRLRLPAMKELPPEWREVFWGKWGREEMDDRDGRQGEREETVIESGLHCYSEQCYGKWLVYKMQDQIIKLLKILGFWWPMHTDTSKKKGTAAKRPFCKQQGKWQQQYRVDKSVLLSSSVCVLVLRGVWVCMCMEGCSALRLQALAEILLSISTSVNLIRSYTCIRYWGYLKGREGVLQFDFEGKLKTSVTACDSTDKKKGKWGKPATKEPLTDKPVRRGSSFLFAAGGRAGVY